MFSLQRQRPLHILQHFLLLSLGQIDLIDANRFNRLLAQDLPAQVTSQDLLTPKLAQADLHRKRNHFCYRV
jgi:hypothetical protein